MRWNHHVPLICELKPITGYYLPEPYYNRKRRIKMVGEVKIPNKGYRNFAYILNSFITNSGQTVITTEGASRTWQPWKHTDPTETTGIHCHLSQNAINIGLSLIHI